MKVFVRTHVACTAAALLLLCGCSTVTMHLPQHELNSGELELADIIMSVGETKLAVTDDVKKYGLDTQYVLGLISEDPSIVKVEYQEDNWRTGVASIKAVAPGKTRVFYVNAALFPDPNRPLRDYGAEGQRAMRDARRFPVTVVP